jgi:hypothetical protein
MFMLTTPIAAATNWIVFQRRIASQVVAERVAPQPALY